jgi:hypothetical protein
MTASMVGLFAMSIFGGSLFVSFVDGLVTEAICFFRTAFECAGICFLLLTFTPEGF